MLLGGLSLLVFVGSGMGRAFAFVGEDANRIAREIIASGDYQTTLPGKAPPQSEFVQWLINLFKRVFGNEGLLSGLEWAVSAEIKLIFWVVSLIGLSLFAYFLAIQISRMVARRAGQHSRFGDAGLRAGRVSDLDAVGTLADADKLAAEGDYAGAVRMLLFRSLEEMKSRIDQTAFPFLTSREIMEQVIESTTSRAAFGAILAVEELSHFGGRTLDASAYAHSRESFLKFADAWGEAAA